MDNPNRISFNSQINLKEYKSFYFRNTYRSPIGIGASVLGILIIVLSVLDIFNIIDFYDGVPYRAFSFGVFMVFGSPFFMLIYTSRKSFQNGRSFEKMKVTFDSEKIEIIGESFETKFDWEKLYKIEETDQLILIWQTKRLVHVLSKKNIQKDKMGKIRKLALSIPSIKKKMNKIT